MPESLFNKAAVLKNRLWHKIPENFAKFLRTHFFTKHLRWLLLILEYQNIQTTINWDLETLKQTISSNLLNSTTVLIFSSQNFYNQLAILILKSSIKMFLLTLSWMFCHCRIFSNMWRYQNLSSKTVNPFMTEAVII